MRKRLKKFLEKYKQSLLLRNKFWILLLTGVGIFIDIFIFDPTWDLVILFLTGLWILVIWLYKFEGKVSLAGGLVFLSLCPFLLIFKKEAIAEKAAIWAYMFLVVGVVQEFIEYLRENRKK